MGIASLNPSYGLSLIHSVDRRVLPQPRSERRLRNKVDNNLKLTHRSLVGRCPSNPQMGGRREAARHHRHPCVLCGHCRCAFVQARREPRLLLLRRAKILRLGTSMKRSDNAPLYAILIAIGVTVGGIIAAKGIWELVRYVFGI